MYEFRLVYIHTQSYDPFAFIYIFCKRRYGGGEGQGKSLIELSGAGLY